MPVCTNCTTLFGRVRKILMSFGLWRFTLPQNWSFPKTYFLSSSWINSLDFFCIRVFILFWSHHSCFFPLFMFILNAIIPIWTIYMSIDFEEICKIKKWSFSKYFSSVRFISYLKTCIWRQILKLSWSFGCLFTFCYSA